MVVDLGPDTFFTADLHFDHKFAAAARSFASVDNMNAALIDAWNGTVRNGDAVVVVGDFCWYKRTIDAVLPCLNGVIHLVLGNHDTRFEREYRARCRTVSQLLTVRAGDARIECCHFPLWAWNRMQHGAVHAHGHQHGDPTGIPGKLHDVGVDNNSLRLLSLRELLALVADRPARDHHGR